jgi:exonuclease VII small subunit
VSRNLARQNDRAWEDRAPPGKRNAPPRAIAVGRLTRAQWEGAKTMSKSLRQNGTDDDALLAQIAALLERLERNIERLDRRLDDFERTLDFARDDDATRSQRRVRPS